MLMMILKVLLQMMLVIKMVSVVNVGSDTIIEDHDGGGNVRDFDDTDGNSAEIFEMSMQNN